MDAETPPASLSNWEPRIRHIAGLGIHELSRPDSRAAFLLPNGSPRQRRPSHASLEAPLTRARAPTLAGEGYSHAPIGPSVPEHAAGLHHDSRRLVRCFIALLVPDTAAENGSAQSPPMSPISPGSLASPNRYNPGGPAHGNPRSGSTLPGARPVSRSRTLSLPPKPSISLPRPLPESPSYPASASTSPVLSPVTRRSQMTKSAAEGKRPGGGPPRRPTLAGVNRSASHLAITRAPRNTAIPFFLSSIHDKSTHPRWSHIETCDFASWLTVNEAAGTRVEVQVWIEERGRWRRLQGVGGVVDLSKLVPVSSDTPLPPNTIQWKVSSHPKHIFYLPPAGSPPVSPVSRVENERGVLERSVRETRMKKGTHAGGLTQLVNIQSVIADTRRNVSEVQRRIDGLIARDVDRSALRRDVGERALHVRWITDRIAEVERNIEETKSRITLHRGRLDARRALLAAANERDQVAVSQAVDLSRSVAAVETERSAILPEIYRLRAHHAQELDIIFPIVPLHAPNLLYSILGVPLPIPTGSKDPAPPLSLPAADMPAGCIKVDERTTAAALGYAALLVQLISTLGGAAAGLAYPVTYAGSRSHVRDVVSVMQGPRSFPLYGKGTERYRYEYAVFLLNKDIELLMHEADIRLLDLRHTLPNLKNLLVTLSSSEMPPPGPVGGPGWASGAGSRSSSRRPSTALSPFKDTSAAGVHTLRASSLAQSISLDDLAKLGAGLANDTRASSRPPSISLGALSNQSEGPHSEAVPTPAVSPPPRIHVHGWASPPHEIKLGLSNLSPQDTTDDERGTDGEDCDDGDSDRTEAAGSDGTQTEGYVVQVPRALAPSAAVGV